MEATLHALGQVRVVHTAVPPAHLGGMLADVAEIELRDGTTLYGTGTYVAIAREPDARFAQLLAKLGRAATYAPRDTVSLAGPDSEGFFDCLLFVADAAGVIIDPTRRTVVSRVVGITTAERELAKSHGSFTLLGYLLAIGQGVASKPGRPTDALLAEFARAAPRLDEFDADDGLSDGARRAARAILHGSTDHIEAVRSAVGDDDLAPLVTRLVDRLQHPAQLRALLSVFRGTRHPLLATVAKQLAHQLLQGRAERDPAARGYLADAWAAHSAAAGTSIVEIEEGLATIQMDEDYDGDEAQRDLATALIQP